MIDEDDHHFGGGVYAKQMHIAAGLVVAQHKHNFDHLSVLASGSVEMDADGVRSRHEAPACLTLKAGVHHGIKALTDVVWYCIHATECVDASQVDMELIMPSNIEDMKSLAEGML